MYGFVILPTHSVALYALFLPFSGNEYKFLFIVLSTKRDCERFNCRKGKESKFHCVIFQKSEVEVKNDDLYGKFIVRIHPCFTCKKVNNILMTEIIRIRTVKIEKMY